MLFKKDDIFIVLFNEIQHDPVEWPEPHRYIPERFDTHNQSNRWTKTTDGKPRNPLSFTPFFGGKRVCLGKTFAEITVRFTVPLIFHHLNLEFVNPVEQSAHKDKYFIGGFEELKFPMKVSSRNKVKI